MATIVSYAFAPPIPPPPPSPPLPFLSLSPMPRKSAFGVGVGTMGEKEKEKIEDGNRLIVPRKGILKNTVPTATAPAPISTLTPPVAPPASPTPPSPLDDDEPTGQRLFISHPMPLQPRQLSPSHPKGRSLPPSPLAYRTFAELQNPGHVSLPTTPSHPQPTQLPIIAPPPSPKPTPSVPSDVTFNSSITDEWQMVPPLEPPQTPLLLSSPSFAEIPSTPSSPSPSTPKNVVVETRDTAYIIFVDLDGAPRDGISISTRRKRTLRISASADNIKLFERKITFGADADLDSGQVRGEFDGKALKVTIPRKDNLM